VDKVNEISKNRTIDLAQKIQKPASQTIKRTQSFEHVMKDTQSHQQVQLKGGQNVRINRENKTDNPETKIQKLEELSSNKQSDIPEKIKSIVQKLEELSSSEQSDDKHLLDALINLLQYLQNMIKQDNTQVPKNQDNSYTMENKGDIKSVVNLQEATGNKNLLNYLLLNLNSNTQNSKTTSNNKDVVNSLDLGNLIQQLEQLLNNNDKSKNDSKLVQDISQENSKKLDFSLEKLGQILEQVGVNKDQVSDIVSKVEGLLNSKVPELKNQSTTSNSQTSEISIETNLDLPIKKVESKSTDQNFLNGNQLQQSNIKQFALFVGKTNHNQTTTQFVKDFQNIISKAAFSNDLTQQKLFIKLFPENLGRVTIELVKNSQGMMATIIASTSEAKELLQSNLDSLKQAMQSSNLQLEKIDLYQSMQTDRSNYLNQERQQEKQEDQSKSKQQSSQNKDDETSSFLDELMKVSI
jgi:flagellar hook-length control protein FliK